MIVASYVGRPETQDEYNYNLFLLAHYLINRCCVTVLHTKNETWSYEIFQSLDELKKRYNCKFDLICHFFLLEHIREPINFIQQQLDLL